MLLNTLVQELQKDFQLEYSAEDNTCDIIDIELIDGENSTYNENILYFGHCAQLSGCCTPPNCVLDGQPDVKVSNLVVADNKKVYSVFNRAKGILLYAMSVNQLRVKLMEDIMAGKDLQGLLNTAAAELCNSIIVLDKNFKVLRYSTIYPITDPLWAEIIARGYCTYSFLCEVYKLKENIYLPDSDEAAIITCYASPLRKLYSKIIKGSKLMGYVLMLEQESKITTRHLEALPLISRTLGDILSLDPLFSTDDDSAYTSMIYEMIIGADPKDIKCRIEASNLSFPEWTCALAIRAKKYMGTHYLKEHLDDVIHREFPDAHTVYHEEYVAVMLAANGPAGLSEDALARLEKLAKDKFLIGISNCFNRPEKFAYYYGQVRRTLEIGCNRQGCLIHYYQYSFYDMISSIDRKSLGGFCHPSLGLLNSYDHHNNTELYATLKMYIECSGNLKKTADSMFIHRNTLKYRLDRIQELTGLDLDNSEAIFSLACSYRIDVYLGKDG